MGRELSERPNGDWWVIETTSNAFMRVSSVFDSKEAVIGALKQGGLLPDALEQLHKNNCIYAVPLQTHTQRMCKHACVSIDTYSYICMVASRPCADLPSFRTIGGMTFGMSEAVDNALKAVGCYEAAGHDDCTNPGCLQEAKEMRNMPGGGDLDFEKTVRMMMNGVTPPGMRSQIFDPAQRARAERAGQYRPYHIGGKVELHSLQRTEYNGLEGTVLDVGDDGRLPVKVSLPSGDEKSMRVKYENLVDAGLSPAERDAQIQMNNLGFDQIKGAKLGDAIATIKKRLFEDGVMVFSFGYIDSSMSFGLSVEPGQEPCVPMPRAWAIDEPIQELRKQDPTVMGLITKPAFFSESFKLYAKATPCPYFFGGSAQVEQEFSRVNRKRRYGPQFPGRPIRHLCRRQGPPAGKR